MLTGISVDNFVLISTWDWIPFESGSILISVRNPRIINTTWWCVGGESLFRSFSKSTSSSQSNIVFCIWSETLNLSVVALAIDTCSDSTSRGSILNNDIVVIDLISEFTNGVKIDEKSGNTSLGDVNIGCICIIGLGTLKYRLVFFIKISKIWGIAWNITNFRRLKMCGLIE